MGVVAVAPATAAIFTMCGAALHVVPDAGLVTVLVVTCDEARVEQGQMNEFTLNTVHLLVRLHDNVLEEP